MKGSVVKTTEFVLGYTNGNDTMIMKKPKFDYIPGFDTHYSLYYDETKATLIPLKELLEKLNRLFKFLMR